jgi:hypothetical protein
VHAVSHLATKFRGVALSRLGYGGFFAFGVGETKASFSLISRATAP